MIAFLGSARKIPSRFFLGVLCRKKKKFHTARKPCGDLQCERNFVFKETKEDQRTDRNVKLEKTNSTHDIT